MTAGTGNGTTRGGGRDDGLPFLTVAEADRVRFLVWQAFAEQGREVTVHAGHVQDDRGDDFGLWNVAAACHHDPRGEEAWAQLVAEHVRIVSAHERRDLDLLTSEEIWSRIYAKLSAADELAPVPDRTGLSYLREPVPGLLEWLVADLPEAAVTLTDTQVRRFGGMTPLRNAALANLRALPAEERKHVAAPDGATFDVLLGNSVYTASRVLVMSDLLAQMYGTVDSSYGVFAAMPARDRVAVHVITTRTAVPSLPLLARFAQVSFADSPGPLSPNVFWWRDGAWAQVTQLAPGKEIRVLPNPELIRIMQQLDAR